MTDHFICTSEESIKEVQSGDETEKDGDDGQIKTTNTHSVNLSLKREREKQREQCKKNAFLFSVFLSLSHS